MPAINDNSVIDVTTEEGRRQRLEQLRGEARNAAYEVGKAVTRSAIAQGAMRDLGDLTNFMAGAASAGSLHLATEAAVAAGAPDQMYRTHAEVLQGWGEMLIALAQDVTLLAQPPASATTQ